MRTTLDNIGTGTALKLTSKEFNTESTMFVFKQFTNANYC